MEYTLLLEGDTPSTYERLAMKKKLLEKIMIIIITKITLSYSRSHQMTHVTSHMTHGRMMSYNV